MRRDIINTAILWFVLTFVAELLLPNFAFPVGAAQEAAYSDESFRVLLVLGTPVFTFVVAVLGYSLYKFRARGETLEDGAPTRGNSWVSGLWLAVTGGLCLLVIIHPGLTGLAKFAGNNQAQLVVKVIGRQWAWDVEYPTQRIGPVQELVLPVGERVKFEVTAADVLHSFWIPAFRNKIDAVPGTVTTMYITPDRVASFEQNAGLRAQCAEICGLGHAVMSLPVRIVTPPEFETWIQSQAAVANPVKRGERLAKTQGCTACHSTTGSPLVGPTWKDLYGNPVSLSDGTTVTADAAYLRESITDPNAKIVKGFSPNLMPPSFAKILTAEQIDELVVYTQSLSQKGNVVQVGLKSYSFVLSANTARAGQITFSVGNESSSEVHEIIIAKTDLTPAQLPLRNDGSVDETKLSKIGALEDIDPSKGGVLTVNLSAGRYLLICNFSNHFKQGMHTEFIVSP